MQGAYKGDLAQILYGVERDEVYDMETATATVAETTLTDTALAFGAVDRLKGQLLTIMTDAAQGNTYLITGNTATVITCDGATFVTDGVDDEDRFSVTTFGIKPAATATVLGVVQQAPAWEPEIDVKEYHTIGGGRRPVVNVEGVHKIEKSLDFLVQNAGILGLMLGGEAIQGSTPANANDLDGAVLAGDDKVTLTSAAGYSVTDYIEISSGIDFSVVPLKNIGEVRQITAIDTNLVTLDAPLRFDHDDAEVTETVVAPFTHTFGIAERSPSIAIESAFKAPSNFVRHVLGTKVAKGTITCEAEGPVQATFNTISQDIKKGLAAASAYTVLTTKPFFFNQGVFTFNGATIARLKKIQMDFDGQAKGEPYISDTFGTKIGDIVEGAAKFGLAFTCATVSSVFWDVLEGSATITASIIWTRGSNDTVTITVTGLRLKKSDHPTPESGLVLVESEGPGTNITLTVVDSTAYYH